MLLIMLVLSAGKLSAQTNNYPFKVATSRMLWHDKIDAQQQRIAEAGVLQSSDDELVNLIISSALMDRIDRIQESIELDTLLSAQEKVKYLVGVE